MSDTQIQVLAITFILAAAIVLPLTVIAFRKEKRRRELKEQRARQTEARERQRREADEAERQRAQANQAKKETVMAFETRKDRLREIRSSVYTSPPCSTCGSALVQITAMGADTGVLTARCIKCDTERRIYARSKEAYLPNARELSEIMSAYAAVREIIPDYPGLAVSFPEPTRDDRA